MSKTLLAALFTLVAAPPALGQEVRTNADGSAFIVSIDPRSHPRMDVDAIIAIADDAQRGTNPESKNAASIRRLDLALAEDVNAIVANAPFQETMRGRWVWIIQMDGRFQGGQGPHTPDYEGHLGWYLIDDGSGAVVAWGFTKDKQLGNPPAESAASAATQQFAPSRR
jgi:hypothetical protein